MNRYGGPSKRTSTFALAGPEKRHQTSLPEPDWLDLPTHLPNAESVSELKIKDVEEQTGEPIAPPKIDPEMPTSDSVLTGEELHVAKSLSSEAIYIEGTTILLQTDEDIAKWIEERRKNWPTRKNVAAKIEQRLLLSLSQPNPAKTAKKPVCRFFAKHGKCKFGKKCKNLHESAADASSKFINGISVKIPQRYKNNVKSGSLFKNLVQRDLFEHENDLVIDFIKYLHSNSAIDLSVNQTGSLSS